MSIKFISLGYRCSTALIFKSLNIKNESFPFDWLVSRLDVIRDCIETEFKYFIDKNNYINFNNNDKMLINKYYDKTYHTIQLSENLENNYNEDVYFRFKLFMNHYLINDNFGLIYYKRCILRLKDALLSNEKKIFCYIHPLIYNYEFDKEKINLCNYIIDFNNYILTKTSNAFGIYFILILDVNNDKVFYNILLEDNTIEIIIVYVNKDFKDKGWLFEGTGNSEISIITDTILKYNNML